jgi:hypothetical protein
MPVHSASLVPPALHSPALLDLLDLKLIPPVIDYVVDAVVDTVDYAIGRPSTSTPRASPSRNPKHAAFTTFVTNVLERAEVSISVVLASLVYIDRAKPHLHIKLEEWACERVFLGAVMLASKYLNDSTLKNVHWALCTGVFGKRDVGRIERELLDVLDFELGILEDDILSHHDGLSTAALPKHIARHHPHPLASLPALEHASIDSDASSSSSSSSSSSPQTPDSIIIDLEPEKAYVEVPSYPSGLDIIRAFPIPKTSSRPHHYSSFALHQHHAPRAHIFP